MPPIELPIRKKLKILSLGAESAGVFAVYKNGSIFVSENFDDLLDDNNFIKYKKAVLDCLKREKIKPDAIITDSHPLYKTTLLGEELARKFSAYGESAGDGKVTKLIKVQHHLAHIFSALGDKILISKQKIGNWKLEIGNLFYGIAADGTGYGFDGNIWGGEVFKCQMSNVKCQRLVVERIGSLEEQLMIGGDLAVKEPARMLIAILAKIPNSKFQTCSELSRRIPSKLQITNYKLQTKSKAQNPNFKKEFIYHYVKKFYTRNKFEALYNQLDQNFNCQITTSTGRILDAVSILLGFADNKRDFKHEATKLLERNSSIPYKNIELRIMNYESRKILDTTYLFEYLIKNIKKDKKRLAATTQYYLARGFCEIIKNHDSKFIIHNSCLFAGGGMANNRIISEYLEKHGVYVSKKISRGDDGIAFGQIIYYLFNI